jgi:hypothetical protein
MGFREAYDLYVERVEVPVSEGAVRRWLNTDKVSGLKRGTKWYFNVQDLVRYHMNKIGVGKRGKKGVPRRARIKAVSPYELEIEEWPPHVEKFLKGRKSVRLRHILDLIGVPYSRLSAECSAQADAAQDLLEVLGWERMSPPKSFDWAPSAIARKARKKKQAKSRTPTEVLQQARALVRHLKAGGMYTLPQLRKHFGLSQSQAKTLIYSLIDEGKILALGQSSHVMYYDP